MKRFLKWTLLIVVVVAFCAFLAFLYYIPPFETTPAEDFVNAVRTSAPSMADISDPAERALAERGKYIAITTGCDGCHNTYGPQGAVPGMFMAGGSKVLVANNTTVICRNLTPDAETGLGKVADEDVLRVLRSGVARDGRSIFYRAMPWAALANWTEEDRRAVLVYLRHLEPVSHRIPDPLPTATFTDPLSREESYFGADYGIAEPKK